VFPERVVLVGFMGSGKTRVGRELANRLGWRHVDLDREIEVREGVTIPEYFERHGETAFRAIEAEITPLFTAASHTVISTGGGWVTNPGMFEALPSGTLTVFLRVAPEEVLRRVSVGPGRSTRPLLAGPDPAAKIVELMAARDPLYSRAMLAVETDRRSPRDVAEEICRNMQGGEWQTKHDVDSGIE
jgi:shikimate kinase